MKKTKIMCAVLAVLSVVTLAAGCANRNTVVGTETEDRTVVPTSERGNQESEAITDAVTEAPDYSAFKTVCKTELLELSASAAEYMSFKDQQYYYYMIYLGKMYNVAIEDGDKYRYDGKGNDPKTFADNKIQVQSANEKVERTLTDNTVVAEDITLVNENISLFGTAASLNVNKRREFSTLETYLNTKFSGEASSTSASLTYNFSPETKYPGNYLYIALATVDVYAAVTTDTKGTVKDIRYLSSVVQANRDLVYIGEDNEYTNESVEKFSFDVNAPEIQKILKKVPTLDISGKYQILSEKDVPVYCGKDKAYVKQNKDDNAELVNPCILKASLNNCGKEGKSFVQDGKTLPDLALVLTQDMSAVETLKEKYSSSLFSDTADEVNAFGSSRKMESEKVGYGTAFIRITKNGQTESSRYVTDILSGTGKGETVHLFEKMVSKDPQFEEDLKAADKVEVEIVFEIKTTKILDTKYTNWKYEFTLDFAHS